MILLWFACYRDVVVGLEQVPSDMHFDLIFDGQSVEHVENNVWKIPEVDMRIAHSLSLYYGKFPCWLSEPDMMGELGLGELQHLSQWKCIGLLEYDMKRVGDIWVGTSEVTVALFQKIYGEEKEDSCGATCPKSGLSWLQSVDLANQLSMMEGLEQCYAVRSASTTEQAIVVKESCLGYRLPTDAEWDMFSDIESALPYAGSTDPTEVGWMHSNSDLQRHPVCTLKPNKFALCDVTGNVWEWCEDVSVKNPKLRRVRGGGYTSVPDTALLSNKIDFPQHIGADHIGLRLVRDAKEDGTP